MSETTTNIGIPLPGAEENSRRLTDIRIVKTALVAIDGAIAGVEATAETKLGSELLGMANGVATLDAAGKVPATQLPSFVDDVLEYASLAAFPSTGESGKIYVAIATGFTYRWSGTVYVPITSGAVDSVNGKNGLVVLTKSDLGLGNVDNTSDAAKPVSAAQASAIANAEGNAIAASAPIAHVGAGGGAHAVATTSANGFMSASDKVKLNNISGNNTGDQTNIAGNAGTATRLATPRTINGVAFDGTQDITIDTGSGGTITISNGQIGFGNSSGNLTGSSAFTWDPTSNTLRMGTGATNSYPRIIPSQAQSPSNVPSFTIAGTPGATNGAGGAMYLQGGDGDGTGSGNHLNLRAGNGGVGGGGGSTYISGGSGANGAGHTYISGGNSGRSNTPGGDLWLNGGTNYSEGTIGTIGGGAVRIATAAPGNAAVLIERFRVNNYGAFGTVDVGGTAAFGTSGQVLVSKGQNAQPAWENFSIGTQTNLNVTGTVTTANLTAGNVTVSGDSITSTGSTITIDPSSAGPGGTVVIAGNLQVTGATTTIDSTTVTTAELNLQLAKNAINAAAANGAGISVAGSNATLTYSSADDRWNLNKALNVTTIFGALTGNASTATKLATARNINGVAFDGTADITVTASAAAGSLTGNALAAGVTSSSLTSVGTLTSLNVSGTATVTTLTATNVTVGGQKAGYLTVPQRLQGSYTLGATDSAMHLYNDTGGVTWTIPANSVVPFDIGTTITFANGGGAAITIAITSDTLIQNKVGAKTSLTLAPYGMAVALKVSATKWMISGDLT